MKKVDKRDNVTNKLTALDQAIQQETETIRALEANLRRTQEEKDKAEEKQRGLAYAALGEGQAEAQAGLTEAEDCLARLQARVKSAEIALESSRRKLEGLRSLREKALERECWEKCLREAEIATKEAEQIEKYLDGFMKLVAPHRERLLTMTRLYRESGRQSKDLDTRHLWRRLYSRLHRLVPFDVARQPKEYDAPYPEILSGIVAVMKKSAVDFEPEQPNEKQKAS
jgi:hypothetical protein